MKARTEESQQDDNAFKALQAVASTTSDNYKDDEAYQHYQSQHNDVPDREREFLKTLIHFQTQNLQIFERKQSYINKLEAQLKTQEDMKTQLEEALRRGEQWRQQVQEAERKMHQANEQYQEEIRIREEEIRIVKAHNEQLVKEKECITKEHIQEAYLTNLNLHQRTTDLEKALHDAEAVSRERARLIREMEEIPKIPISPDDQLETEHRIVMQASSNMVDLALEQRSVDQTLTLYYNSLTASSVQYSTDLTQPLPPHQLTLLLQKYSHYTHPILAMSFFRGDLCLEDQTEIFQLPLHPIILNFRSWCRCIQESTNFAISEPIMELSKPSDLPDYPYPQEQIFESQFWMQTQGWIEARTTYQFLVDRSIVQYSPMGIVILYNRVYECIRNMYTTYTNNFDTSHVAYPEHMTTEEQQA